jgi:hypothetical protein
LSYEKANEDPTFISRIITGDKSDKTIIAVEGPIITKSKKKSAAGPDFSKEHAHFFSSLKGIVCQEFVPPNTTVNSDF